MQLFLHYIIYPFNIFLDGLDVTKQKFTGRIDTSKNVISSQGALNYEGIITKENPNKTAPGVRKLKISYLGLILLKCQMYFLVLFQMIINYEMY